MKYKRKDKILIQDRGRASSPKYKATEIQKWLQNPVQNEDRLRTLSNYLYNTNPLYKWTINTIGLMPKYNWKITMDMLKGKKSQNSRKNVYYDAITYVDKLNLPYEMIKVFLTVLKEDWFYGYEFETDDSYFILPLPSSFCKPSSRNLDGTYNFAFNFQYFDDKQILLASYPKELRSKYNEYKRTGTMWIELETNNAFCLKYNDEFDYTMPYYASLFDALFNVDYYKEIKKDKAENDNILLLHQKIPMDENDYNKFALSFDLATMYHNMADQGTPDRIGVLTSPMDITSVKTESSKSEKDYVKDATRDAFIDAGLPQSLSNSDNATSVGLAKAIIVNEQLVFRFFRQIERIVNRKLKAKFPSNKFKFRLLNTTSFNESEFVGNMLTLAQNGLPNKIDIVSASGKSPYEFFNDLELEEGVFELSEILKPLKTSYTQSAKEQESDGAPKVNDDILSESGQRSRDSESDANKKAK